MLKSQTILDREIKKIIYEIHMQFAVTLANKSFNSLDMYQHFKFKRLNA